jgi:hypothetical protein
LSTKEEPKVIKLDSKQEIEFSDNDASTARLFAHLFFTTMPISIIEKYQM